MHDVVYKKSQELGEIIYKNAEEHDIAEESLPKEYREAFGKKACLSILNLVTEKSFGLLEELSIKGNHGFKISWNQHLDGAKLFVEWTSRIEN